MLDQYLDQRAELAADPALIPGAVEEILRFEPLSPTAAASRRLASYLVQAFRSDRATPLAPPLRIPLDLPGSRQA
ncbi:hypothetical protein FAIPA1_400041 [Frankia sp. AiPs1]